MRTRALTAVLREVVFAAEGPMMKLTDLEHVSHHDTSEVGALNSFKWFSEMVRPPLPFYRVSHESSTTGWLYYLCQLEEAGCQSRLPRYVPPAQIVDIRFEADHGAAVC